MNTDTREALAAARSALGQLIEAGKAVKAALDAAIPDGEPVHPESRRLTWPISSGLLALDAVDAALATQPAAQPSAQGEAVLDRESTWWSLAMGAAASLEDAANCMRDEDAERAALGAAAHVRKQCAMLTSAPAAPAQFVAHELSPSKERAALASVVFQGLTHDERLVPSEALRASLLGAKLLLRGEPAQPSDSTGAMAAAWFGTPGTEREREREQ
jgi:hypothetical protein